MVDQIKIPTPGLIVQLTGRLTTKRYNITKIVVNQATRLNYAYFQKTECSEKYFKYKQTFEIMVQQNGVKIKAHHTDNGIFRSHAWVNSCKKQSQELTCEGVNANNKNGIEERCIGHLQDITRTQLIHATKR